MSRFFVDTKKTPGALFILLAMVAALTVVMATSAIAAGTTIGLDDFVDGVYTINEGGEYRLADDAAGTIVINTDQPVKIIGNGMSGTPNSGLTLDCVVAGADLTIEDLYIDAPVTDKNVINFTGIDNNLKMSGESLLENSNTSMYYAAIHVPSDGSLTIDGKGTLNLYKRGLGAGIGGNCSTETGVGETNGDITIAGGTIFAKGSQSGATIGAGMKGTGGNVYITGGVLNLMTKGRAAVIGGGGEQGGEHGPGGNVYISGGTLLLYTDWSGSQIGCGNGNTVYNDGGNVYISGGSLKTVITSNACQPWNITPAENIISDAAITANKLNNSADNEAVYQLVFDTSVLSSSAESFTVEVDEKVFYTGAGHEWKEGDPESYVNGGAFAADNEETKLYLYVTGEDHTLTVNEEAFQAIWDASTSTFTVEPASTGSAVWDGTADTSWYDAGNPLSAYTISTPEQLAGLASLVNVGNSFADVTFTLANDMNLNSESSSTNWTPIGTASVTLGGNRQATVDVDSATPFAGIFDGDGFAINGLYISSDANMQGLFGYVTGEVKNLTINGDITSTALEDDPYTNKCVGSVAAFNHKGTIADVINNVTVNAPNTYFVGGITGYNLEGTITRSANLAAVTGCQCVGGITGRNGGTITYTYNNGKVDGTNAISKNGVGGIAGKNGNHNFPVETGTIDSCYNADTVGREGQKWVGGIAGFQNSKSFTRNCYASGTIVVGAGRYAPIIGQEEGTSSNNYSLDTLSYDTRETVIGTRLSDADLKTAAPLLGGAFVNDIGDGYPVLFWQRNLALNTITVAEGIEGGVVEAPAGAVEGSTVIVTITPNENYRLVPDSLTYTIAGEVPVVITAADGVYSFIMPASDITLDAAFEISPAIWDGTADTSWYTDASPGTTEFHISTPEQLHGLADIANGIGKASDGTAIPFDDFTGKTIYLDNDIWLNDHISTGFDETAHEWEPIGWAYYIDKSGGVDVTPFNGTLDGQGHTIHNMYQYQTGTYGTQDYRARGVALVGYSAEACVVKNITIIGYCYGNRYVGGIVGKVGTKVQFYSPTVGPGTTVENCVSYVTVVSTGSRGSGGIIGAAWNYATIRNCINYGSITGLGTDNHGTIGGIAGDSEGLVENCVNYGTVTNIASTFKANAGGVVGNPGSRDCVTRNCYNLGVVHGGTAGGVIGFEQGTSYNCYNLGSVSSSTSGVAGGVIGEISGTTFYQTNLYYLETAAEVGVGKGGGERTKVESFAPSTDILDLVNGVGTDFEGRSFVANTTNMNDNTYPILRFQTTDTSTLENISIVTPSTKVVYTGGEVFNPAGMVVRAYYSDNTSEFISDYTYPTEPLKVGTESITISYKGKSVALPITVNPSALDLAKEAAKNELDNYKDPADYREAQQDELAAAVAAGKDAIDAATDIDGVNSALADAKAAIDKIKTDAQLTAEEIEDAKEAAKDELDNYKDPADYREAQQDELAAAVAKGKDVIDAATDIDGVAKALADAKAAIDEIKTDAQLTAEELEAAKKAAKNELDKYKDPEEYRETERDNLADAVAAGKDAIDAATDIDGVEKAMADAKAAMDKIKTDAQLTEEEEALEAAKAEAKEALESYKNPADYREAQQAELEAAIEAGKDTIDAATGIDGVAKALADAKAAIDKIKTDAQLDAQLIVEEKEEDTTGVKTGDAFPMAIQLIIFSISLIGVACLLIRKRHTA